MIITVADWFLAIFIDQNTGHINQSTNKHNNPNVFEELEVEHHTHSIVIHVRLAHASEAVAPPCFGAADTMVLKFVFFVNHLIIYESRVVDISQKVHFFIAKTVLGILSEVFKLFICLIDEERVIRLCCLLKFLLFLLFLDFLSHALEELSPGVKSPH